MKRGALHFLGRKNQSLFDTNIKIKDMDNVELVLDSPAILESGTASVRARPTVKHHTSSYDSFQGFAVPTPKVPLLPPVNGPKANGIVGWDHFSSGSDLMEEEIVVPPHPSVAPPPPPGTFIPPPPDFMGDLNSLDPATFQPPSVTAPKPTSLAPYVEGVDFTSLKPPPMAPPKPPSTGSIGSASSVPISSPPSAKVPDHPNFAPPQPPSERHYKTPPPKPIRLSSISNLDSPPQTPAPPPPVQTRALTTFNPQKTPNVYNVPETSILSGPKKTLVLEDSAPVNSAPVDGKAPTVATPSNPVSKNVQELMENLRITQPPQPETKNETKTESVSAPPINKPPRIPYQTSPELRKVQSTSKDKLEASPIHSSCRFSPLLDHKLRNLKSNETSMAGPAASPMALLMAAKEREKHRSTHSLSRENSAKKNDQPSSSIHSSDSSPNSFVVTPKSSSSLSLAEERKQENPKSYSPVVHTQTVQTPEKSSGPAQVKDPVVSTYPAHSRMAVSPSASKLVVEEQNLEQSEELNMPLLPPPPEFDDLDDIVELPPSILPPDPPMKKVSTPTLSLPKTQAPSPPPKPKPPAAPQLPPPDTDVKLQFQTKSQVVPNKLPPNITPSQATLLSILQKKMLEMDHKMAPAKEAESSSDDWGTPLSPEDNKAPVFPRAPSQSKNYPEVNKSTTLNVRELEGKVVKKYQETSSVKVPTSNGVQSKHQYGMTFTVRPGTKQPITFVSKGDS